MLDCFPKKTRVPVIHLVTLRVGGELLHEAIPLNVAQISFVMTWRLQVCGNDMRNPELNKQQQPFKGGPEAAIQRCF